MNKVILAISFLMSAIGASAQTTPIAGENIIVDGNIVNYSKYAIKGLSVGSDFEVFDLKVLRRISGEETSETIRVVYYFYSTDNKLPEDFLKIGNTRRFLLNKLISPTSLCEEKPTSKENRPCYLLQPENVTVLEDERLLNFSKYFPINRNSPKIETAPSRIINSNLTFVEGKASPSGRYLLSKTGYESVSLLSFSQQDNLRLEKSFDSVQAFNFSSDSKIAILTDIYGKTIFWETEKKQQANAVKSAFRQAQSTAFSVKNNLLIFGNSSGKLYLINPQNGEMIKELKAHNKTIISISFSPDEKCFATGSGDGTAKLWSLDGKNIITFSNNAGSVTALTFSPDGKYLLTAGGDKIARLWSLENGKEIMIFQGHSGTINSLIFSVDGKIILTGSSDGTVRVWKLNGNQELILVVQKLPVGFVSLLPDTNLILSGGYDNQILLWDISSVVSTSK